MIVFIFLLFCAIGFAVQFLYNRRQFYKFADNFPQPKACPIGGHAHYFLGKDDEGRLKMLHEFCTTFKRYLKLWLGPNLWIFVNEPEIIQKILLSPNCLEKPFFYKFLRLENGLISAKYDTWKLHRKALNYSFNLKILQTFIPIFNDNSKGLVDDLMANVGQSKEFDLLGYTTKSSVSMICGTSFGLDVRQYIINDDVFHALENLNKIISARSHHFFLYPEPIYRMTKYYRDEMKSRAVCYFYSDHIIKEKREALMAENEMQNNNNLLKDLNLSKDGKSEKDDKVVRSNPDSDPITRKIFIDHVICNETKFSDLEVRDHVYTVVAAGSETTALQSAHAMLLLAMHPKIQDRVVEELREVFYNDEVPVDYESITKLTYLERVIKESLRLCPVVPIIGRETQTSFKIDEYELPAGMTLLINFFSLHRRKDIWGPNADEFNPDNFLPEFVEKRHPYAYLPFSSGTRNCIGYRYAMMALKIIMLHLLKQFKFSTSLKYEELRFRTDINLKLCTEHLVSVELRKF